MSSLSSRMLSIAIWTNVLILLAFTHLSLAYEQFGLRSQPGYDYQHTGLKSRLSPEASILFPNDPLFANATLRWQDWEHPDIVIAVEVATENDVAETVSLSLMQVLVLASKYPS